MSGGGVGNALPPKPEPPDPGDCCGGGACSPCVYDAYEAALNVWRQQVAKLQSSQSLPNENINESSQ